MGNFEQVGRGRSFQISFSMWTLHEVWCNDFRSNETKPAAVTSCLPAFALMSSVTVTNVSKVKTFPWSQLEIFSSSSTSCMVPPLREARGSPESWFHRSLTSLRDCKERLKAPGATYSTKPPKSSDGLLKTDA